MTRLFDEHPASQPCWHICQLMNNRIKIRINTTRQTSRHAQTPQIHIGNTLYTHQPQLQSQQDIYQNKCRKVNHTQPTIYT